MAGWIQTEEMAVEEKNICYTERHLLVHMNHIPYH